MRAERDTLRGVEMFALVGETLRRLRKERGKTLAQIGAEAQLGRGQLSRIENAHQEATLSTLAKILTSQGVSRREFFRRYDLVENEAEALGGLSGQAPQGGVAETAGQAVAQGAIEIGDMVVHFRVVPKSTEPRPEVVASEAGDKPKASARPPGGRGSRKKR